MLGAADKSASSEGAPASPSLRRFAAALLGENARPLFLQEGKAAATVPTASLGWSAAVQRGFGYEAVYSHQAESDRLLRAGKSIIITTPTASGKTGAFYPAVFSALEDDPVATALMVFPLVALGQDQREKLQQFARAAGHDWMISEFQGKDSRSEDVFREGARIVTATPDKLHWQLAKPEVCRFLSRLRYLVLDEAHTYRGGFGAEVSGMLRRLLYMARSLGARPQVVLCTATIGNPAQFARDLLGKDGIAEISTSGAAVHPKHYFLADHGGNPHLFWEKVVASAARENVKALVFLRSRKQVNMLYERHRHTGKVFAYMNGIAGRSERLSAFRQASSGVMFATNALEAGVDIGDLDVVLIDSYPGSRMAFRQMAGRAGRTGESLVFFLPRLNSSGVPSPVDAFYSNADNFANLLQGEVEKAVIEPHNPTIEPKHLGRLRQELQAARLTVPPELKKAPAHGHWLLRGSGVLQFVVVDARKWRLNPGGAILDALEHPSEQNAHLERHPEAMFTLDGQDYRVSHWQADERRVIIFAEQSANGGQETRGLQQVLVDVRRREPYQVVGAVAGMVCQVQITVRHFGYQIVEESFERLCMHCNLQAAPEDNGPRCRNCGRRLSDRMRSRVASNHTYEQPRTMPPLSTTGLMLSLNPTSLDDPADLVGAMHSFKHAIVKLIPELVDCDPGDVAAAFIEGHENRICVYDNWNGGLGIVRRVGEDLPLLLRRVHELLMRDCCGPDRECYECTAPARCTAPFTSTGEWRPVNRGALARALQRADSELEALAKKRAAERQIQLQSARPQAAQATPASAPENTSIAAAEAAYGGERWPLLARELLDLHGYGLTEISARLGLRGREVQAALAKTAPVRVRHKAFGDGVIVDSKGRGGSRQISVRFGNDTRQLHVRYAEFEVIRY